MQQLGAKSMDRLHFKSAWGFQCAGEQTPRQRSSGGVRLDSGARADRRIERAVVERGPFGERIEDAFRHVGGGRLGEGDAEYFFRRHAFQQKVDDTLCQHMRLARSGIGGNPGRHFGIRHRALQLADLK